MNKRTYVRVIRDPSAVLLPHRRRITLPSTIGSDGVLLGPSRTNRISGGDAAHRVRGLASRPFYCFTVHHRGVRETHRARISCGGKDEGRRDEGDDAVDGGRRWKRPSDEARRSAARRDARGRWGRISLARMRVPRSFEPPAAPTGLSRPRHSVRDTIRRERVAHILSVAYRATNACVPPVASEERACVSIVAWIASKNYPSGTGDDERNKLVA